MATGIPELEEPAQAKAALTGLWQARQFHEAAALAAKAVALDGEGGTDTISSFEIIHLWVELRRHVDRRRPCQ